MLVLSMYPILQSWSKTMKHIKRKKGKKPAGPPDSAALLNETPVQQAVSGLQSLQQSLSSCLSAVHTSCNQLLLEPQQGQVEQLLTHLDPCNNTSMHDLVGWEERLSVEHTIRSILNEQRQVLQQVTTAADKMTQRLTAVSF